MVSSNFKCHAIEAPNFFFSAGLSHPDKLPAAEVGRSQLAASWTGPDPVAPQGWLGWFLYPLEIEHSYVWLILGRRHEISRIRSGNLSVCYIEHGHL